MPIDWSNVKPARLIHPLKSSSRDGFLVMKMHFQVPLMQGTDISGELIDVYAELVYGAPGLPPHNGLTLDQTLQSITARTKNNSILLYLCGGPGDGNPALAYPELNKIILERLALPVLYVNFRGTGDVGDESRVCAANLAARAHRSGLSAAEYLALFRQDSIAADLESIRLCLGGVKYRLVGQSFGGWVAMTYLSRRPEALEVVYLTGGMPPIGKTPEQVYDALYRLVERENEKYYAEHQEDKALILRITRWLEGNDVSLNVEKPENKRQAVPAGKLTAKGFMTMGRHFGRGKPGRDWVHSVVNSFADDIEREGEISNEAIAEFLKLNGTGFKLHLRPLYAAVHELIYCTGPGVASEWAAQRLGRQRKNFRWLEDGFEFAKSEDTLYFSGEMIYQFMLKDAGEELEPFIKPADVLARSTQWSELYDEEQLRQTTVPVKALIYPNDMFLDFGFSTEAAKRIRSCEQLPVANHWIHASIKTNTAEVCDVLFDLKTKKTE